MNSMTFVNQWGPAIFMVIAIWIGLIYNNKRLDDFKDLLKAIVSDSENRFRRELGADIAALRTETIGGIGALRTEMVAGEGRIRADIAKLGSRIERLEEPHMVR